MYKQIKMKLNEEKDADVLARLNQVKNKQGYIKQLVRDDEEEYKLWQVSRSRLDK